MVKRIVVSEFFENTYAYIIGKDCILVDPGIKLNNKLNELDGLNIKAILLTHAHVDHIDSISLFNCPIYISKDEKEVLYDDSLSLYNLFGYKKSFDLDKLDIHYIDTDSINILNKEIKVIKTPGHTKGSVCYLIDDIMFTGDTLFNGSMGRTDFPTGNIKEMEKSLKLLMKYSDSIKIYPGHGEDSTIGFERKYNPFIK